jgi:Na+-transporting methylmalonyl-CoA/oxaloacetate decarboxylase gamma subunit
MFPDSDPTAPPENVSVSPSLPKWRFFLADIIVFAAGLALWATQSPLSALQTLLVLGLLGLGAVLSILPFVMEYMTRTQLRSLELEQARAEDFQRLAALDAETRKQARAAMDAQEHAARATAALENLARKFDARLAPLEASQKALDSTVTRLEEFAADQSTVLESVDERRQAQLDKLSATTAGLAAAASAFAAALKRLDALADQPPPGPDPGTVATLETIHERLEIMAHLLAQFRLPEPDLGLSHPVPTIKEKTLPEGGSLLAKALSSAQPADTSPAVARIIEAKPRKPRKPKAPATPEDESAAPAPESTTDEPAIVEATASTPDSEIPEETIVESDAPAAIEDEPAPETLAAEAPAAEVSPEPAVSPEPDTTSDETAALRADPVEPPPAAQAELLDAAVETTRKRRAKPAPTRAILVARVLIGIGNKPYVRGEGPGLSPNRGVPMEFVEIGQWRWVAPADAADPIRVTIYKNDEVPAEGGPIQLHPGETIEVSPAFPV